MGKLLTDRTAAWIAGQMGAGRAAPPPRRGIGPRDLADGPPWPFGSRYAFGISIAGPVVTVHAGGLEAAGAYYVADAAGITITGDGQYIALEFDRYAGSLAITGPHASRPVSDADVYRTPLYVFDLSGESAVLARECINDLRLEAIA